MCKSSQDLRDKYTSNSHNYYFDHRLTRTQTTCTYSCTKKKKT